MEPVPSALGNGLFYPAAELAQGGKCALVLPQVWWIKGRN